MFFLMFLLPSAYLSLCCSSFSYFSIFLLFCLYLTVFFVPDHRTCCCRIAELAVLCAYVENQAILEPILYRASKCKETKEKGSEDFL